VPERVVDLLEVVEIHNDERGGRAGAPGREDRLLDPVREERPVRQARERIRRRPPRKVRLSGRALGHVMSYCEDARPWCAAEHGDLERDVPAATFGIFDRTLHVCATGLLRCGRRRHQGRERRTDAGAIPNELTKAVAGDDYGVSVDQRDESLAVLQSSAQRLVGVDRDHVPKRPMSGRTGQCIRIRSASGIRYSTFACVGRRSSR
jgi:hypothetical protein